MYRPLDPPAPTSSPCMMSTLKVDVIEKTADMNVLCFHVAHIRFNPLLNISVFVCTLVIIFCISEYPYSWPQNYFRVLGRWVTCIFCRAQAQRLYWLRFRLLQYISLPRALEYLSFMFVQASREACVYPTMTFEVDKLLILMFILVHVCLIFFVVN